MKNYKLVFSLENAHITVMIGANTLIVKRPNVASQWSVVDCPRLL